MKCAIYQFNPIIGALEENTTRLIENINASIAKGCDIFIASELAICGYIPKDLLFRADFHKQMLLQLNRLLKIKNITLLIGAVHCADNNYYNSVFVIRDGNIIARYDKQKLPNYEVFDECRYFTAGILPLTFKHNDITIGIIICEDTWYKEPAKMAKDLGAEILISINASPFTVNKYEERLLIARTRVSEINIPLIYVNQLGGQDDIVFDGASFILNSTGQLIAQFPAFTGELNFCELDYSNDSITVKQMYNNIDNVYPSVVESVYLALVLSTYDYVTKNGFKGVLLGLSGGIDSALTLAIAYDAFGADKIMAVMMPSEFTLDISVIDAKEMANTLNVAYQEIAIHSIFNQVKQQLQPIFNNLISPHTNDTTEENLQARIRGMLLMGISNKLGYLLLTTGNKSEMAVGYATLYGDMAGGFAPLKDVSKTLVYQLSHWRNKQNMIIPNRIITRAPSAELRENQTDQDFLPDYDTLDAIIKMLVEDKLSTVDIIAQGFDQEAVMKVAKLIKLNEYKRSQAAIGPKISICSFGNDWRYPITNHFSL